MVSGYFNIDALKKFQHAEGAKLASVFFHFWDNLPADYSFLSWLELVFDNDESLVIGLDEDQTGLNTPDFDIAVEIEKVMELGGQVEIRTEFMNDDALWSPLVGTELTEIGLIKEAENWYKSDQVLLKLQTGSLLIQADQEDGITVTSYQ